jgi:hypothetical protein
VELSILIDTINMIEINHQNITQLTIMLLFFNDVAILKLKNKMLLLFELKYEKKMTIWYKSLVLNHYAL